MEVISGHSPATAARMRAARDGLRVDELRGGFRMMRGGCGGLRIGVASWLLLLASAVLRLSLAMD